MIDNILTWRLGAGEKAKAGPGARAGAGVRVGAGTGVEIGVEGGEGAGK